MCFFRRKTKLNKSKIESRFKKGDFVNFRYRDELCFGWIWSIYTRKIDERQIIHYDIQVGGQCPAVVIGIPESKVLGIKKD